MVVDVDDLEGSLLDFFEQVRILLVQETWENILMNCTKNELMIMILLYRSDQVNMSQIAEYLQVPLNTATGIVSRMEKKDMVMRIRSNVDKRVVTIVYTDKGKDQMAEILNLLITYGKNILSSLTGEELVLAGKLVSKVISVVQNNPIKEDAGSKKLRKIVIE